MASSAQASSAQASSAQVIPIQEYIVQHPIIIDDVLTRFEVNMTPFLVAISEGHDIIIYCSYSEIPTTDHATIGKNVTDIIQLSEFFAKHKISCVLDMAKGIFGMKLSFCIWLNDKPMPFFESINEFMSQVSLQSHTTASFIALTLAYDNLELNIDNFTKRAYQYQNHGLPPVRPSTAVILNIGMKPAPLSPALLSHAPLSPALLSHAPLSPAPLSYAPLSYAPLSPAPMMENLEENPSGEAIVNSDEGFTQIQRNKPRKQYVGAGPPPVSVPIGSSHNGSRPQKGGICDFQKFWENGERGIEGVVVPEEERFKKYTRFALNFHKDFTGKGLTPEHEIVQKYMQENLGLHYPAWAALFLSA
jgi:hypothetical protein